MNRSISTNTRRHILIGICVVAASCGSQQAHAKQVDKPSDNDHRQIAAVIPGMPRPITITVPNMHRALTSERPLRLFKLRAGRRLSLFPSLSKKPQMQHGWQAISSPKPAIRRLRKSGNGWQACISRTIQCPWRRQ